jgi:hypothetical protein
MKGVQPASHGQTGRGGVLEIGLSHPITRYRGPPPPPKVPLPAVADGACAWADGSWAVSDGAWSDGASAVADGSLADGVPNVIKDAQ